MIIAVTALFFLGYALIALESPLRISKSASALFAGALAWALLAFVSGESALAGLEAALSETASIVFFLLGAMTIVELMDSHGGFRMVASLVKTGDPRRLLWILSIVAFFLSAILDNLTTTIVMVTLASKLVKDRKAFLFSSGLIVIAANAGGAWSPIGDVTTTMLWIADRVSVWGIIRALFIPALVSLFVPLAIASFLLRPRKKAQVIEPNDTKAEDVDTEAGGEGASRREGIVVFLLGILSLILVPVLKSLAGIPPWAGILFGLGFLWLVTDLMHRGKPEGSRETLTASKALTRIDHSSLLFFLGILLVVAALREVGALNILASSISGAGPDLIAIILGLISAIVDNVPLVAGAIGMYDLSAFTTDHSFWEMVAYCAGTGGSILIIGSAAGVVAMGLARISFGWYLKRISLLALAGYFAGIASYLLLRLF